MKQKIEILASGHINRDDSAFPTLVKLDNGNLLCGFNVGGGPLVTGGTDWALSSDNGKRWRRCGTILPPSENPVTYNNLRLSKMRDGTIVAYGTRKFPEKEIIFGNSKNEPIFCVSKDNGETWSPPHLIPNKFNFPLEISNPMVETEDGRWLAPAAVLAGPGRLGEKVVVFESTDKGNSWEKTYTVFIDPEDRKGFFEQKLIPLNKNRILATAWTVTMKDYQDLENHYSISNDGGKSWPRPKSMGIMGQTLTPLWLGKDRFLLLYNRRYDRPGVIAILARFKNEKFWNVEYETFLWDAKSEQKKNSDKSAIEAFNDFAFGLPSAIKLEDEHFLAVHWCKENGHFVVKWTKLQIRN